MLGKIDNKQRNNVEVYKKNFFLLILNTTRQQGLLS